MTQAPLFMPVLQERPPSAAPEGGRVYSLRVDPGVAGVYIGRPGQGEAGPWGNPVALGLPCPICATTHPKTGPGRDEAITCYDLHLRRRLEVDPDFARRFDALQGKSLLCFCAPRGGLSADDRPYRCHGQVMLDVLAFRAIWGICEP